MASSTRHDLLKSPWTKAHFDHSSATIEEEIKLAVEALGKRPITDAFDAATFGEPSSVEMMAQSVSESIVLSSASPRKDSRFLFPLAITKDTIRVYYVGTSEPFTFPARLADH